MKIIQTLKQPIYLNRIKAFGWSMLYSIAIFALAIASDVVPTLGLSEFMTTTIIHIVNGISKFVHEKNK